MIKRKKNNKKDVEKRKDKTLLFWTKNNVLNNVDNIIRISSHQKNIVWSKYELKFTITKENI